MADHLLRIDGISGDSTQRGFERWFTLTSYDWEIDGSQGGRPAGLPLVVRTLSLAGLVAVERKAAEGARIAAVELVALASQGRSSDWYLKLLLTDPVITASTVSVTGAEELISQWSFGGYSRADITTRSKDSRGNWLPEVSATWRA
ncbi:MAG: type VI secretion system tube protein Hcp [bacterium]